MSGGALAAYIPVLIQVSLRRPVSLMVSVADWSQTWAFKALPLALAVHSPRATLRTVPKKTQKVSQAVEVPAMYCTLESMPTTRTGF